MFLEQNISVLHVEDSQEDAFFLERSLKKVKGDGAKGFDIHHALTFKSALKQIRNHKFNVILLDLNLPDQNGIDTLRLMKEFAPDIPVIVTTGTDCDELGEKLIRFGAQEYLPKSFLNSSLLKRIIQSSVIRKEFENELFRKAHYDEVTGLPNRLYFEDVTKAMLRRAKRWGRKEALFFIDLDGFKAVNDTFGHDAGDAVLKQASMRMKSCLRNSDLIARFAGDEFVIYMDSDTQRPLEEKNCSVTAEKIIRSVSEVYKINGHEIHISCSVGVAMYPDSGLEYDTLLQNADAAMYQAKRDKEQRVFFA